MSRELVIYTTKVIGSENNKLVLANSRLERLSEKDFGYGADMHVYEALIKIAQIDTLKADLNIETKDFISIRPKSNIVEVINNCRLSSELMHKFADQIRKNLNKTYE